MKKLISISLIVLTLLLTVTGALFAAYSEKNTQVNKALLDAILSNRSWVAETLVQGDRTNNPYSSETLLMNETLSNYKNDAAFKAVVDALEYYGNSDEYIQGLANDVITYLMEKLGLSETSALATTIDKLMSSTSELKYEGILNDVLKSNYSSSFGDELYDDNMRLEVLQQRASILQKLSVWQKALRDINGVSANASSSVFYYDYEQSPPEISFEDYTNHFLNAYESDLADYLDSTVSIPVLDGNNALKHKVLASTALASVYVYEKSFTSEYPSESLTQLFGNTFAEASMNALNVLGKPLSVSALATNYAILLEALQSQKTETIQTMSRLAANTNDTALANVMQNYIDLYNASGNQKLLAYETITNYIRNNGKVTNFVASRAESGLSNLIGKGTSFISGGQSFSLKSTIAKATKVTDVAVWLADYATGIESAAKKIYVCKYTNKIINEIKKLYNSDLNNYYASRTEENAEKVLSDLELLKALRLYGEKTAYNAISAQMNSWIGVLLGGGETSDYLKNQYQGSVDSLLGCTLAPVREEMFTIPNGCVLNINTQTMPNGKNQTIATYQKDGKLFTIGEADLFLMGGIDLNGGALNIYSAPNGFYTGVISNSVNGGEVNIYCPNVAVGELLTRATTAVNFKKDGAELSVSDRITNSSNLTLNSQCATNSVEIYQINNNGTIGGNIGLIARGNVSNSSNINLPVSVQGNTTYPYGNAYYRYASQYIYGGGSFSSLVFENTQKKGITVKNGSGIRVTGYLSDDWNLINGGKNVVVTGNCYVKDGYKSPLTVQDYQSPAFTSFENVVYVSKTATFSNGALFNSDLNLTNNATSLSIKDDMLTVNGDLRIDGGIITGNATLNLKGDLYVSSSGTTISDLNFNGLTAQNCFLNYELTVNKLDNNNSSLSGVRIDSKIYVTDLLKCSNNKRFSNGNNIYLTGNAGINNDLVNGSISAQNWTSLANNLTIKGTLNLNGNVKISDNLNADSLCQISGTATIGDNAVIEAFSQSSGTITFGDNTRITERDLIQAGTLIVGNNCEINLRKVTKSNNISLGAGSELECEGTFESTGELSGTGKFVFNDDCILKSIKDGYYCFNNADVKATGSISAKSTQFDSKMPQVFTCSGTSTVEKLTIKNSSKAGFQLKSILHVTKEFLNEAQRIDDIRNLYLDYADGKQYQVIFPNEEIFKGNYTVENYTKLVVTSRVIVKGDLTVPKTSTIVLKNGGEIIVKGSLFMNESALNIESNGQLTVNNDFSDNNSDLNIDGNLIIVEDTNLSGTNISGIGTIHVLGDLQTSNCTWNICNLNISGKSPQVIKGSEIFVNNLEVQNNSKSGIILDTKIYVSGAYHDNGSVIHNENKIIEQ